MTRFFPLSALMAALLLTGACADVGIQPRPQVVAQPDKVSAMLAQAADKASNALQTLAEVEQTRTPGADIGPIPNAPPELRRAITINWTGPVEPLAKTLADRAGYMFQALGDPPPAALVVSIDAENQPVIDVLRNVGLQLGKRADVKVDGSRKMVEIHYAPVAGAGG